MARREMISVALTLLEQMRRENSPELDEILGQMELYYQSRWALLEQESDGANEPANGALTRKQVREYDRIAQKLRDAERSVALRLRNENKIHDEVLRELERELDLLDARYGS